MPTPTEQLQKLLTSGTTRQDFKQLAMALARQGADITVRSTSGARTTLLHVFVCTNKAGANNDDIVELVELNPAVLESKDYCGRTALQSLIDALRYNEYSFEDFKQSVMILARQGADLSQRGKVSSHPTLLHVLALKNMDKNIDEINALIDLDSNVINFKDGYGRTPVHSLLANNSDVTVEAIDKLLSEETNLNLMDSQDATLLHAACSSGNLPAVKHLFGKGLSLTALTNNSETLIHYAVLSGNVGLIQWLIDTKQIDINAKDQSGETPLHRATRQNNQEVIELLTRNGVDLTIQNNDGQRASKIATSMGYHDLVSYLINSKEKFFYKIQAMHDYGVLLKDKSVSKGEVAINLANKLTIVAKEFFQQAPEQRNFAEFELRFSALLHSKDKEMSAYRVSWGTIVANIAIAFDRCWALVHCWKIDSFKSNRKSRTVFLPEEQNDKRRKNC